MCVGPGSCSAPSPYVHAHTVCTHLVHAELHLPTCMSTRYVRTWFMLSSISPREALFAEICTPLSSATMTRPTPWPRTCRHHTLWKLRRGPDTHTRREGGAPEGPQGGRMAEHSSEVGTLHGHIYIRKYIYI